MRKITGVLLGMSLLLHMQCAYAQDVPLSQRVAVALVCKVMDIKDTVEDTFAKGWNNRAVFYGVYCPTALLAVAGIGYVAHHYLRAASFSALCALCPFSNVDGGAEDITKNNANDSGTVVTTSVKKAQNDSNTTTTIVATRASSTSFNGQDISDKAIKMKDSIIAKINKVFSKKATPSTDTDKGDDWIS